MACRGFICFVIGGRWKTAYYHGGSRPEDLGVDMLRWLRSDIADLAALRRQVAELRVVDYGTKPSSADIERLGKYAAASGRPEDWDDLLEGTAGNPALILDAGVLVDQSRFPADSLSAEWGYVVDVDEEQFEVYRGFQTSPHSSGRFAAMEPIADLRTDTGRRYYPVALRARWSLTSLPEEAAFLVACATRPKPEPLVPESFDAAGCLRSTVAQFELAPDDPDRAAVSPADATAAADDVACQLIKTGQPAEAAWRLGQELAAYTDASPQVSVRRKAVNLMVYNLQVHTAGLTDLFPDLQQSAADGTEARPGLAGRLEAVRDALTTWHREADDNAVKLMRMELSMIGPDASLPDGREGVIDALYAAHHIATCESEPAHVHAAAGLLLNSLGNLFGLSW